MAAISTMSANWSSGDWSLNTGGGTAFAANTTDSTRLEISHSATSSYVQNTAATWDLTASSWSAKYHFIPNSNTAAGPASQLSVEWRDSGGTIIYRLLRSTAGSWTFSKAGVTVGTAWTELVMRANPYFRIRESGGTTFFEVSANGTSGWATPSSGTSTTNGTGITTIRMRIQPSAVADSGFSAIQEVNGAAAPTITDDVDVFLSQQVATAAAAALNTSPTAPTVLSNDLSILSVAGKLTAGATATSSTPSGWTLIGTISQSGTAAANAADTGDTAVVLYYRTDSGYGNPTISTTGFNSMASAITVFRGPAGCTWDLATTTGSDTASGANISITGAGTVSVAAGDIVAAFMAASGDVGTPSAFQVDGMSGVTLYPTSTTPINRDVTTGNDSRHLVSFVQIRSGSSSAAPTYSYTNSSSTTGHARFLRIRAVTTTTQAADAALAVSTNLASPAAAAVALHEGLATRAVTATLAAAATVTVVAKEALAASAVTSTLASSAAAVHEAAASLAVTSTHAAAATTTAAAKLTSTQVPRDFTDAEWFAETAEGVVVTPTLASIPVSSANPLLLTFDEDYDLDSISIKLDPGAAASGRQVVFEARALGLAANMIRFVWNNGTLTARRHVASAATTLHTVAWDPAQPYLRMRSTAGVEYWDRSADGKNWTNLVSDATGLDLSDVDIRVQAVASTLNESTAYVSMLNSGELNALAASTITSTHAAAATVTEAVWDAVAASTITSTQVAAATATHAATASLTVTATVASVADKQEATYDAVGTLAATATSAAAASATHAATASLAVTSTHAAVADKVEAVYDATSSLAVTATLTAAATVTTIHEASASLVVTASRVAGAAATHEGLADLDAAAALATAAVRDVPAASALAVSATRTAAVALTGAATSSLTVTAATAGSSTAVHEGLATSAVTSTLAAAAARQLQAAADLDVDADTSAAVALSANALAAIVVELITESVIDGVDAVFDADADLGLTAALDAEAARVTAAQASAALTADLDAQAVREASGTSALTVTSTTVSGASATHQAAASLGISVAPTADAEKGGTSDAEAALSATVSLTAAATVTRAATGALAVTAARSGHAERGRNTTAVRAVTATLTAAARVTRRATAALTVTNTRAAQGRRNVTAAGALNVTAESEALAILLNIDAPSSVDVVVPGRDIGSSVGDREISVTMEGRAETTIGARDVDVLVGSREA